MRAEALRPSAAGKADSTRLLLFVPAKPAAGCRPGARRAGVQPAAKVVTASAATTAAIVSRSPGRTSLADRHCGCRYPVRDWALRYNPGPDGLGAYLDEGLERHYLGMVTDELELAPLEEHLLACSSCAERLEEAIRTAIVEGDDLGDRKAHAARGYTQNRPRYGRLPTLVGWGSLSSSESCPFQFIGSMKTLVRNAPLHLDSLRQKQQDPGSTQKAHSRQAEKSSTARCDVQRRPFASRITQRVRETIED